MRMYKYSFRRSKLMLKISDHKKFLLGGNHYPNMDSNIRMARSIYACYKGQ